MSRYLRQPRVFGLLGLAALAAGGLATLKGAGPTPAESHPFAAPGVVCFGHVDVEHGVASLAPVQPGRVVEVLVAENEPVRAGAALVRLDDDRAKLRVQEAAAALRAAQTRLARMRTLPQQHQLQAAQLRA